MKGDERRAAIVSAAIRLFSEKGFRGTTTRELASSLGVTEPVLYQHFRTKHDLYCAIIEEKSGEMAGPASELEHAALGSNDRTFFTILGRVILDRYDADPALLRLVYFSCLEGHELSGLFYERLFVRFYKLVAGYIRRRIREGAFRDVNPETAARGAIGIISYHGLVRLLFPGRFGKLNQRKVVDEMVGIFLAGITAPPPGTK